MKAYIIASTITGNEAEYLFYDKWCGRKWREDHMCNVDEALSKGYKKAKKFGHDVYVVDI